MRNVGITFDDEKHTYRDFGMICTSLEVGLPELKTKKVELKGADGYIDLTEVFGRTMYGNRTIKAQFVIKETSASDWANNISKISNYLHGRKRKIVLDMDKGFFYEGRIQEKHEKEYRPYSTVTLTMDCYPFKREVEDSSQYCWKWDSFSLVDGIIREYNSIDVDGDYTMVIIGREQVIVPTIYSDAAMTVDFEGNTYELISGKNYIYQMTIKEGRNELVFHGTGTISVQYRGGKL